MNFIISDGVLCTHLCQAIFLCHLTQQQNFKGEPSWDEHEFGKMKEKSLLTSISTSEIQSNYILRL
jgi:hypothetical protein